MLIPERKRGVTRGIEPLRAVHSRPCSPELRHGRVGENRTLIHRVPKTRVRPTDFYSVGHLGIEPSFVRAFNTAQSPDLLTTHSVFDARLPFREVTRAGYDPAKPEDENLSTEPSEYVPLTVRIY